MRPAAGDLSAPSSRPARRWGAGRGAAIGLLLVAAAVTALAAVPTWASTTGASALGDVLDVTATGSELAPGVLAAAVVLLASAGATTLVGRVGRWVVAAVVALAGGLVVAATLGVVSDPVSAMRPVLQATTGVGQVGDVHVGPAPWAAVVVGVLDVLLAGWLVRASATWATTSRAHGTPGVTSGEPDERADWDALTRGDDPS